MSDTESDTEPQSRYNYWFATGVCSVVALVAFITEADDLDKEGKTAKWAASAITIAMSMAWLAVFAHALIRSKFVGTHLEGGMALIALAFWAAGLPAIMDPNNDFAQRTGGTVNNANLYYFSWGAFVVALLVFTGFLRDVHGIGKGKQFNAVGWTGLMAASFIVMATGIRTFKSTLCEEDDSSEYCKRTKFALSIGVICGCVAFCWILIARWLPDILDTILSVVMLVIWVFGVGYITFGDEAPAKEQGNLYFSTWASFVISAMLTSGGLAKTFGKKETEETTEEAKPEEKEAGDEEEAAAPAAEGEGAEKQEQDA